MSSEYIAAAALLSACIVSEDADAIKEVCGLPRECWPNIDQAELADVIQRCVEAGEQPRVDAIAAQCNGNAENVLATVNNLASIQPTCNPERCAVELRAAWTMANTEAERKRIAALVADSTIPIEELRHIFADSPLWDSPATSKSELVLTRLLDWKDLRFREIPCVFRGLMPRGGMTTLIGDSGIGKTYLTLQLSLSVALGCEIVEGFEPIRQGTVLLLLAEDHDIPISQRIESIRAAYGITEPDIDAVLADGRMEFSLCDPKALLAPTADGTLERTPFYRILESNCKARRYDLICVDPLINWAGLVDENPNGAMAVAAECLKDLAKSSGGAVLVGHHSNKAAVASGESAQTAARGGSALQCSARCALHLRKPNTEEIKKFNLDNEEATRIMNLTHTKNSYGPMRPETYLERVEGGALVVNDLRGRAAASLLEIAEAIAEELRRESEPMTAQQIWKDDRNGVRTRVYERLNPKKVNRGEVENALDVGVEEGVLRTETRTHDRKKTLFNVYFAA